MARKVFMRLDHAACKGGIIGRKIGFTPGALSVVLAVSTAACTGANSGAGSRAVVLAVRHVAAAPSTRKVDAGTAAGEGKSAPVVSV